MKRTWLFYYIVCIAGLFGGACSSDEDTLGNDEIPPWNKSNTVTLIFCSKLNGEKLISSDNDYSVLTTHLKSQAGCKVIVLDRCNTYYDGQTTNPSVSIAKETKRVHAFARNAYDDTFVEGSGILIDHTISEQKEIKVNDVCYFKQVLCQVLSNEYKKFGTICLKKEQDVDSFIASVRPFLREGGFVSGTIASGLFDSLQKAMENSGEAFRLEKVQGETSASFQVFVLTSKSWILRQQTTNRLNNLNAFHLQLECIK